MTMKEEMKEKKGSKTAKFVAFALAGLAAGAAVYYLFGTTEGRKTLNKAVDGVNGLSKTLKAQAEEGLHRASHLANRAKEEYQRVLTMADDARHDAMEKADKYKEEAKKLTKKGLKYAEGLSHEARSKVDKA
uniref:YtxH domain-containing protein n=3 Tax=Sphingobacteriaceae TaxID=84566 RepID=F4C3R5_SPHS2